MLVIANLKMMSGWQAGGMAAIPEPNEMVVDVDTQDGPRRRFAVDTRAGTAGYAGQLEAQPVDLSPEAMAVTSHPLPDHRPESLAEARDSTRPKVVSVAPAQDAPAVAPVTELRLRFDQPMDPLSLGLAWESGACLAWDPPQYDPTNYEFIIPVRLTPGVLHQVVINQ